MIGPSVEKNSSSPWLDQAEQRRKVNNYALPIPANPHLSMYKIITVCFTKIAKLGCIFLAEVGLNKS